MSPPASRGLSSTAHSTSIASAPSCASWTVVFGHQPRLWLGLQGRHAGAIDIDSEFLAPAPPLCCPTVRARLVRAITENRLLWCCYGISAGHGRVQWNVLLTMQRGPPRWNALFAMHRGPPR